MSGDFSLDWRENGHLLLDTIFRNLKILKQLFYNLK
jgi:hypothetical protein